MSRRRLVLAGVALIAMSGGAQADDSSGPRDLVVRVGKLHVGDGAVRTDVVITLRGGKVASVEDASADIAAGTRDHSAHVAAPGFIDALSWLGLAGGAAESTEALTPELRAVDAFDPRDRALRGIAKHGITTLGLVPAPNNVAAGRAGAAAVRPDGTATVVLKTGPAVFAFARPALGSNRVPGTAAGARRLLCEAFKGRIWQTPGESDPPVRPAAIRALEALAAGPALLAADRIDDARVGLETLAEKRLDVWLTGLGSAWDDPDGVAELGRPCVLGRLSLADPLGRLKFPGELARRGVKVALSSGNSPRTLRTALALAVSQGLPADKAVATVTSHAAAAIGLGDQTGRVAPGLDADLLVFDGEPWELRSRLLLVVSDGHVVLDRTKPVKSEKRR